MNLRVGPNMSEYMVIHGMNQRMDGTWFDRNRMSVSSNDAIIHCVVLGPTGVFEIREDSVRAEVYRPIA